MKSSRVARHSKGIWLPNTLWPEIEVVARQYMVEF